MAISVFRVGFGLILLASCFFVGTWALVIWRPKYLLGTVTMLWFRTIKQVIMVGLILLIMGEL
jgi:hypothetical protein